MSDEQKPKMEAREKPKVADLELNAETIQELASGEAEGARGGMLAAQSNIYEKTKVCIESACFGARVC